MHNYPRTRLNKLLRILGLWVHIIYSSWALGPMSPWAHEPLGSWALGPMGRGAHGPFGPLVLGPFGPLGLLGQNHSVVPPAKQFLVEGTK